MACEPTSESWQSTHAHVSAAVHPRNFYVGNGLELVWRPPAEEHISWEIFRGRLLDPAQTRQTRRFVSWNIHQKEGGGLSAEPILSVKWDQEARQIHVVRAILSYVWEGYDAGNNVIESRETTRWVREVVGSFRPGHDSISRLLRMAVRGTSRLPLTSLEAPLPAFSLGQLDYLGSELGDDQQRLCGTWREIVDAWKPTLPSAWPVLETVLRAVAHGEVEEAVGRMRLGLPVGAALLHIFQNVSLSPYTRFVDNALAFLDETVRVGHASVEEQTYVLRTLLRLINRHLTAYDLITYHHRGANYPDALLLDAVLKKFLELCESHPALFVDSNSTANPGSASFNRSALRQACLLRRYYEGLPVPDEPTSPGENARVLPPPHVRVPEEQLTNVLRRTRLLFANDPLVVALGPNARMILRQSIDDLPEAAAWREMGHALFIDRPLGWGKPIGEPDLTPLVSHLGFSPAIARRRYGQLLQLAVEAGMEIDAATRKALDERFGSGLVLSGVPISVVAEPAKPCVSLADARKVSPDFMVVRTNMNRPLVSWLNRLKPIERNLSDYFLHGHFEPVRNTVFARVANERGCMLVLYDGQYRPRLEMEADASRGFAMADDGTEFPAAGLHVVKVRQ